MESHDPLDLLRAVGAALAVFVPLFVFWLQKKDKLHQTKYFVELMHAHEELKRIREQQRLEPTSPMLLERVNRLLDEIDEEINQTADKFTMRPFMILVFCECLVLSVVFSQWSESINAVLSGPSYESGLYFLEGIFQTTSARLMLLMVFVSLSVFLTIKKARRYTDKIAKPSRRNLTLMAVFNVILILVTLAICFILWALDPIVPYW